MATDKDFVDYVCEQAAMGAALTYKRMFGEYGLYVDEKVVAFIVDNSVFLKASVADLPIALEDLPQRPLFPGSKDYAVIDELLDDGEILQQMLRRTAAALPVPKPKPKPKPKSKPKAKAKKTTDPKPASKRKPRRFEP